MNMNSHRDSFRGKTTKTSGMITLTYEQKQTIFCVLIAIKRFLFNGWNHLGAILKGYQSDPKHFTKTE